MLFPQRIIFPPSRKSYHEYGDIGHGTEQSFNIIFNGIDRIYGVAKVQKARYDPKGTFSLMLCHVLCHPVITMSSYISGFLWENPVPNPWMMCNGVSQHGYGFQPTWQVPCRIESEFICNPRLQWRLVFEILIHLWKCSKCSCLKNHPCIGIPLNLSIAICCWIVLGLWFIIIKKWLACSSYGMQTSSVDTKVRLLFELCKSLGEKNCARREKNQ